MVTIAAAADIHASDVSADRVERAFADLRGEADVVLLAGDLTTSGEPEQAEVVAAACRHLDVPIFAVLGNHDYHAERTEELREVLEVSALRVHVFTLEDVMTTKLLALSEQEPDYTQVLSYARALREQIHWDDVRSRSEASPFARAFFTLVEGLGIVEPG